MITPFSQGSCPNPKSQQGRPRGKARFLLRGQAQRKPASKYEAKKRAERWRVTRNEEEDYLLNE